MVMKKKKLCFLALLVMICVISMFAADKAQPVVDLYSYNPWLRWYKFSQREEPRPIKEEDFLDKVMQSGMKYWKNASDAREDIRKDILNAQEKLQNQREKNLKLSSDISKGLADEAQGTYALIPKAPVSASVEGGRQSVVIDKGENWSDWFDRKLWRRWGAPKGQPAYRELTEQEFNQQLRRDAIASGALDVGITAGDQQKLYDKAEAVSSEKGGDPASKFYEYLQEEIARKKQSVKAKAEKAAAQGGGFFSRMGTRASNLWNSATTGAGNAWNAVANRAGDFSAGLHGRLPQRLQDWLTPKQAGVAAAALGAAGVLGTGFYVKDYYRKAEEERKKKQEEEENEEMRAGLEV